MRRNGEEAGTRPGMAEVRSILSLAAPVVGVQLGMMLMGTVDVMMLGRLDSTALAAGALGNAISMGLLMFPFGVLMGLDPLVSQAFGAQDHRRIGLHLRRGLILAVVLSVPVCLLMWDTEGVLRLLGQKEPVVLLASQYIRALIPGNVAFLLFAVLRQTLQAMSIVWPALAAIAVANVINVLANYALIFGHLGLPRLEVLGSALATSTSRWCMCIGLAVAAIPILKPYWQTISPDELRPRRFGKLLRIGTPVGLQISLEMWVFATVAVLMGSLGARELAGHQIALNMAALTFMVPLGLAGAVATRVGNAIGRGDQAAARRSAVLSLWLGGAVMGIFGIVFWSFPAALSRLFTTDVEVIQMATLLLPIAAAFQVADGIQVVGAGILRGTADTRWPAVIALIGYWMIGLPVGVLLASRFGQGPSGLWWGLTLGLATVALLFLARIRARFASSIARVVPD